MASGRVTSPNYMAQRHWEWINGGGTVATKADVPMNDARIIAKDNSPFADVEAPDPTEDYTLNQTVTNTFFNFIKGINPESQWRTYLATASTAIDELIDDTTTVAAIAANDAIVDTVLEITTLPTMQLALRDANAISSSTYVIGKSNIEATAQREKDFFGHKIRLANYRQRNEMIVQGTKDLLSFLISKMEYNKMANHYLIESSRIKFLMQSEELETQVYLDEKDVTWDMSVYQYGCNLMAAISGGVNSNPGNNPDLRQKALGGILSGISLAMAAMNSSDASSGNTGGNESADSRGSGSGSDNNSSSGQVSSTGNGLSYSVNF